MDVTFKREFYQMHGGDGGEKIQLNVIDLVQSTIVRDAVIIF